MAPFRGWFRHMIEPNETTISLTHPTRSSWKVIRDLNEHVYQRDEAGVKNGSLPFYASTKLLCEDISHPEQQAMLRIYMQIPYVNNETPELLGYKEVRQNSTGRVPGGFPIYFARQIVPGIRLGDYSGAKTFLGLEPREQEEIRAAFKYSFLETRQMGRSPLPGAKRLIWDCDQKVVYFLGFQQWDPVSGKQAKAWDLRFLRSWKLVKIPRHTAGVNWDENTEGWEF